jgi:hypothetical protein
MNVEAMASMIGNLPARYNLTLLDQRLGFRHRKRQHENFCNALVYKDSKIVQFFELRESPTIIKASNPTRLLPYSKTM